MKSSAAGKRTSARRQRADVEILSVSPHGIWLLVRGVEHLLRQDEHPWFTHATVAEIFDVRLLHGEHLWWPALDVDLHVDSLAHPERFPLKSKQRPAAKR
ncbi:MAG: DUF2442 domain-containing protein [Myxococcales bacterium]|nr:DUF2442 domain-containing protein [Myxococcales bacterium]